MIRFPYVAAVVLAAAPGQPQFPAVPAPEGMSRLHYLVGAFTATVEFYDSAGTASGTLESTTIVRPILGGVGLEQEGGLQGTPMQTHSVYFVDRDTGRVTWWSLDSRGQEHVFSGEAGETGMTLISRPTSSPSAALLFKRVDEIVDADTFRYSLYTSRDGGRTWTLGNRQTNRRVAVGRDAATESSVLVALGDYVGVWRAEELREDRDGRAFRFRYQLSYYDADRSVVEMQIHQDYDGGESNRIWHGYKGWDPRTGRVYYHGFSPSGRVGDGHLWLDGEGQLVTEYDGLGPTGTPVRIRDVFTRLGRDRFRSVTLMLRAGEWREVNRDTWARE